MIEWFKINGREFPWRKEKDPYKILIAEVMLQRTRANQVVPVYEDFVSQFPNLESVILVGSDEIDKYMKRLGLLWRTDLLMKMVRTISGEFHGVVPSNRDELLSIPGIGDYIADAMIVFAFGGRRIVIDTNIVRIVSRFFGLKIKGEIRRNKEFVGFCQSLAEHMDVEQIKSFNWALIDHPSNVCKPIPCCESCPLSSKCDYFKNKFNS
jgi:A/G-specific adenine glycosylase